MPIPLYKLESFAKHLQDWAERVVDTVRSDNGDPGDFAH